MEDLIREPRQKRAIEKKDKIIEAGFNMICKNGYYNTNTAEIAKKAGVSTGIVYQYFNDKHDILIEGLNKYGDEIFFPMIVLNESDIKIDNLANFMSKMIYKYIKDHINYLYHMNSMRYGETHPISEMIMNKITELNQKESG